MAVQTPDFSKLLNVLPAVRDAGAYKVQNKVPDIIQSIMADKTRNRAISSQEDISREEMFARAVAQDKALAMEGERIRAGQEESALDREAQLEGINRQLMGRVLEEVVKEYGVESLGELRGVIPGFAPGQDEKLAIGDIDINQAVKGLNSVQAPTNPRAAGEDLYNKYLSGEIKATDAITELSRKSGRFYERMKDNIIDLERIKKSDPGVDAPKIQTAIDDLRRGIKPEQMLDKLTTDELDLALTLFNNDEKSVDADKNVIEGLRQGKEVDQVTFIKAADRLKDKNFLSESDKNTAEVYRTDYLNNTRNETSNLINVFKRGDTKTSDEALSAITGRLADAKVIADDKYYKQYLFAPTRNAYEDKLRGSINNLPIDQQISELEKFNKFEQNLGNKNLVSVPIVKPVNKIGIGFDDTKQTGYKGIPRFKNQNKVEITGFRTGSPAEAKRAINELKRLKDAYN